MKISPVTLKACFVYTTKALGIAMIIIINSYSVMSQSSRTISLTGYSHEGLDTLILIRRHEDIRYQGTKIPISSDSTFNFTFDQDSIERFELIYLSEFKDGGWRSVDFFNDGDNINFEIYDRKNRGNSVINGSLLTDSFKDFNQIAEDKWMPVFMREMKSASLLSEEQASYKRDSLKREFFLWKTNYLQNYPKAIKLATFYDDVSSNEGNYLLREDIMNYYLEMKAKYSKDYLLGIINNKINSSDSGLSGKKFIDFYLIDNQKDSVLLSTQIEEFNYTLIDMWSPWCGPCIKKSRTVQDHYEWLNENSIGVVGVIGGVATIEKYNIAKNKFIYPWKVYSEISNHQSLWSLYGFDYSGGGQVLIDKDGTIVAINASVEEIKELIDK